METTNKQAQGTHGSSDVFLDSVHMLQVCGHIKHVVVFVRSAFVSSLHLLSMYPHNHFSLVCEFLADFVDSHTAKTGFLRCCLYTTRSVTVNRRQLSTIYLQQNREQENQFVKAVRLRFYPKMEHNGLPRSIINHCMRPLSSTFFDFS